jgi:hypothetical protein
MKTTATETRPSEGAIRAAKWGAELVRTHEHEIARLNLPAIPRAEVRENTERELAAIIERETNAAAMLAAIKRATPWIGKLIADGGHLQSVAPNDAIRALQMLEAVLAAENPAAYGRR